MHVRAALLFLWMAIYLAPEAKSQEFRGNPEVREAYLRAVATHFGISFREMDVLAAWDLPSQEVPVVLHVATRAGVSPDVVVSLRRDGLGWLDLARRLGLGVGEFYVPLEARAGASGGVYARFRSRPRDEWVGLQLSDREVTILVNVRFLSRTLPASPREVLRAFGEEGDFVAVYGRLGGPGVS